MAGGKETPRQKMIGMMYLVLTALLALQVSSAIIQKFIQLDESLIFLNSQTKAANAGVVTRISKAVEDDKKYAPVASKAEEVRNKTAELLKYMDGIRELLIKETGGREQEDGKTGYKGGKEEEKVAIEMVQKKKAFELKDKINSYAVYLSEVGKHLSEGNQLSIPSKLALDGSEHELFKKDPEQKRKNYAELNFAHTPLVAALAVISQQQSEILKYENEVLSGLAKEVGAADLKFDQVVAMVRPTSKIVAAGTKYEAELFLTASASAITPTMQANGSSIKVDGATKRGKVEFTARPGNYDKDGNAKATWKGKISFNFKGRDTTFEVTEEYIVARPVIQVQSASVSALYKNCGNELNVQVPALGSTYAPAFRADGATCIPGAQKGMVTLVPSGTKVTLHVASGGNPIGSQDFKVRLIPKPTIELISGGKAVNEKTGVPSPGPRTLTMKATPDESFATFLPKDARYAVTDWDCILVRGKRPVATNNFKSANASLANFAASAQPGDRILIEVKKVTRTNFLNKVEEVNLGTVIKNIPLY